MFVSFELKGGKRTNSDGSRTLRAYIGHNGKAYYTTKYSFKKGEWDDKRERVRDTRANAVAINGELARLKNEVEALCVKHPNLSADQIKKLIGKKSSGTFIGYFEEYIKRCERGELPRAGSTVKKYREILKAVKEFEYPTDFNTINKVWYDKYTGQMRSGGCNENTIGNHIKFIKSIMRQAYDDGVSTNDEFRKKYFQKTSEPTEGIALTVEEIKLIEEKDLSMFPHLEIERDRFLISYYLLLSFVDTMALNKDKFFTEDGVLFFKTSREKTGTEAILPVKPAAKKILEKYDFQFTKISNQEANGKLKEIGLHSGITGVVGNKPKYSLITTHTGRRSGATHLHKEGVDHTTICHLGGWTKVETMRQYIKIGKIESAKKALDFEFFK